ncbi:polysaccharide biosynthesis protein [Lysinibacillus sp. KU-BSD001]|uniref:putative polysaccharide biosynthesis protein n=1 Tax=Lysinibacillus sp. KU-BSD001 TaxID=3141328 RepID=UPI0036E77085
MSSLMKGTAILTVGLFLSKVLGLIYVFPFYAIVGEENMVLYQYAYIPYSIMLSIAISGIPLAVSKFVAKYNAMGDYETGRRLLRSSTKLMLLSGLISFLFLYAMSTPIAHLVISDKKQVFTVEEVADVIKWVSFALIVVPFMSLLRGFFQGYGHYLPTSVSQLIEQIARIIILLGGSFIVVFLLDGDVTTAINFAVFAAFIGAFGGLFVLSYYWKKLKPEFDLKLQQGITPAEKVPLSDLYQEILKYSVPIVFVGLSNPLFQAVDMITFNRTMISIGLAEVTDTYFSMLNFLTHKIVIIPVMLATGFSAALIPTITEYYTLGKYNALRHAMDKTYQVLLFVTVPAVVGIMILSPYIYHVLYEESKMGSAVLAHYAPVAILFALFAVTASLLQGIDYQKWIVFSLLSGVLTKLVLNIPLIKWLQVDGAILATAIGYGVTISINIYVIHKALDYQSIMVRRRVLLIFILTGLMAASVVLAIALLNTFLSPHTKLMAAVYCIVGVSVGAGVYGLISFRIGLAQKLLGARATKIAQKLGFK